MCSDKAFQLFAIDDQKIVSTKIHIWLVYNSFTPYLMLIHVLSLGPMFVHWCSGRNSLTRGYILYWLFHILILCSMGDLLPKLLNYFVFQHFDFERTWWRLYQKLVLCSKFDIYAFIVNGVWWFIFDWILKLVRYVF
jgi:hypothetical protein